ncbi:MAG: hypothetical protein ACQESJ_07975 [Bacteroidota bacterium]
MKGTKILIAVVLLAVTSMGYAQKGVGNNSGIARSNSVNEIEQISGELQKIITEPCTQTTGRYSNGTHLLVKDDEDETLNVHLGPTYVMSEITDQLKTGEEIQMKVVGTEDLPDHNYIAKEIQSGEEAHEIRDSNLKPFWAGNNAKRRGRKQ